ncbi:hypothetical protein GGX14DRAFT_386211 [Mycena pura]|uniref:Uncharacterized protein n=1 Tax=Mycena pura TaxID=153505 RepID=A0AAD6YNT7_9AGAR|nr:hypothetical protein GGX14DRAFT_386211 [Mycena pura]
MALTLKNLMAFSTTKSNSQVFVMAVRATLDVSHKAAGQRGILRASYDKIESIYSPGQRGILRERGAYLRESGLGVRGTWGREASEAEAQGVRDPEVKPQRPKGRPELQRIRAKANDSGNTAQGQPRGFGSTSRVFGAARL